MENDKIPRESTFSIDGDGYGTYTVNLHMSGIPQEKLDEIQKAIRGLGVKADYIVFAGIAGADAIISRSIELGKLTISRDGVSHCKKCGKSYHYPRYKSGPKKGEPNTNKEPVYPYGIKFNPGSITFKNSADYCSDCMNEHHILDTIVDAIISRNLPVEISIYGQSYKTRYIRDQGRRCYSCGKTMFESEMNRSISALGSGTYPSECPHCKAVSSLFGGSHESIKEFRMLTVQEYKDVMKQRKEVNIQYGKPTFYTELTWKDGRVW